MAYTKINWQDSPSTSTPITATNLNKMDTGIYTADSSITTINNHIGSLASLKTTNKTDLVNSVNEVFVKASPTTNTFTPTLRGGTIAGSFTYTQRDGKWYKLGNIVFFDMTLKISHCSSVPTGTVQINGLPLESFTIKKPNSTGQMYYEGLCQSIYVNDSNMTRSAQYRKINTWTLYPGKSPVLYAKSFVPGTMSSTLFGLSFGSNADNLTIYSGVQDATIQLSGMYIAK